MRFNGVKQSPTQQREEVRVRLHGDKRFTNPAEGEMRVRYTW